MGVKKPIPKVGGGPTPHFYGLVGFLRFVSMGFDSIFGSRVHMGASVGQNVFWGQILGFGVGARLWPLPPEFWELVLDILRVSYLYQG